MGSMRYGFTKIDCLNSGKNCQSSNKASQTYCKLKLKTMKISVISQLYTQVKKFEGERQHGKVYADLRRFLIVGKVIGLLPIQGLLQPNPDKLTFKPLHISSIISLTVCGLLGANVVMGLLDMNRLQGQSSGFNVKAPAKFTFYSTGFFMYIYFYKKSSQLITLLKRWDRLSLQMTVVDTTRRRDITIIAGSILVSIVMENACGHLSLFPWVKEAQVGKSDLETVNSTAFEIYYYRSHRTWASIVPYHPLMATFVFVSNKFATYAWNYTDILIALFARVISFQFKALCVQGTRILSLGDRSWTEDPVLWRQLARDHNTICNILSEIDSLLSPLILLTFCVNVYWTCVQLHASLIPAPGKTTFMTIYSVWLYAHLVARVLVVAFNGARVHEWAHEISTLLQKCPITAYSPEVKRIEELTRTSVIALNGLGCFCLTKSLILRVLGVVFTVEIFLLQVAQSNSF